MTNLGNPRMRCAALALCAFALSTSPMWSQTQDAPPAAPQSDEGRPHPNMEQMEEHHLQMLTKHLSLTPDQVTQVKAIDQDNFAQMKALHEDTATPQAEKHDKMKSLREAHQAKIRAVLTDEQKPKFDAMVAREHDHMDGHRGGRPGGSGDDAPPPPPPA